MIDRQRILRGWMVLPSLTTPSGPNDDRLECVREADNKRHMEAIFRFTEALYAGNIAIARATAKENDWSTDVVNDLLYWWFTNG